jgi:NAD-dependent deacetylase
VTHDLAALAARIRGAKRLTILTGAGVSAASGVPTFRGQDGLWRQYRPEDLATPQAFARDPRLVWEWYAWRRERIRACRPNAAHEVIASWSQQAGCQVITQNVDDLHVRAGTREIVRLHGSIWELSCFERCATGTTPWRDERVPLEEATPRCPHCGQLARPAVVWFGEVLRSEDLNAALESALMMTNIAKKLFLITRYPNDKESKGGFPKGEDILIEKVKSLPNIEIIYQADTKEILGKDNVTGLKYLDGADKKKKEIKVDGVMVHIGQLPNSDFVTCGKKNALGEIEVNIK